MVRSPILTQLPRVRFLSRLPCMLQVGGPFPMCLCKVTDAGSRTLKEPATHPKKKKKNQIQFPKGLHTERKGVIGKREINPTIQVTLANPLL